MLSLLDRSEILTASMTAKDSTASRIPPECVHVYIKSKKVVLKNSLLVVEGNHRRGAEAAMGEPRR